MHGTDEVGGGGDPLLMRPTGDVLTDGPAGRFLHRDALRLGLVAQRRLLVVGEAQGHGHA